MKDFKKSAAVENAAALDESELALINRQTLRALTADEVFAFKMVACDNQVDRDNECFSDDALEQMAELFVGKPVLMDHRWSATTQTARIYAAAVENREGGYKALVIRCYLPRTEGTTEVITAIESGVLRECSVGLSVGSAVCSICGVDQMDELCGHRAGRVYDEGKCHFILGDVQDCYEVSLVAVPAQPEAGVTKSKRYGGEESPEHMEPAEPGGAPCANSLRLRLRAAEARAKAAGSGQKM